MTRYQIANLRVGIRLAAGLAAVTSPGFCSLLWVGKGGGYTVLTWTQVFSRLSLTPRAHHLWVPEHMLSGGQGSAGSLVCPQCVCAYSECLLRQHPCVPIAWQHNSAPSLCAVTFVPSLEVAVCQTRICTGERKQWHRSDINTLHVQVTVRMHR